MSSSSSFSSHATVTYTSAPLSHVPALEYLKYLAPSDDDIPSEDQPLPTEASPTARSPGYIVDFNPIKDDSEEYPKMDPIDYATDEEDEESFKDDEEEEPLALSNSALHVLDSVLSSKETEPFETEESAATPPPPPTSSHHIILFSQTRIRRACISIRPHSPPSSSVEARIAEYIDAPTSPSPPPSSLLPLSSPLPLIPSPPFPLPSPDRRGTILEADMPPQKRARFTIPSHRFKIGESSTADARQTGLTLTRSVDYGFIDTLDAIIRATDKRVMNALEEVNERITDLAATHRHDSEEERGDTFTLCPCLMSERPFIPVMLGLKLWVTTVSCRYDRSKDLERARDPEHCDVLKDVSSSCVADALADYEANRSCGNGNDSNNSGSGGVRAMPTARVCTYKDFLNCQPLNFKGTEGVVGLTQWFERMESVFHISNYTMENQFKYTTCTLLGNALTWWNSQVKTIGYDAAYGMTWKTLMKMLTDKYCPRSEIKNLEIEIWNLKVKGTDVVEKYVGGLLDMIQSNVMSARPKTMQEAIELANDLMDQKVRTFAERQAENKRKLNSNPRDNQAQQQPFKRKNVARAYTTGPGEKKEYMHQMSPPPAATNNQRAPSAIQKVFTCFECGIQGHNKKDCLKLKNKNRGSTAGGSEAHWRAYAVGSTGTNSDSYVVMGTFLLSNRYASILFDTSADINYF
ncbi:putative reverse transcriptase domain-containing protein [Tanacetum coccineum]